MLGFRSRHEVKRCKATLRSTPIPSPADRSNHFTGSGANWFGIGCRNSPRRSPRQPIASSPTYCQRRNPYKNRTIFWLLHSNLAAQLAYRGHSGCTSETERI